MNNYCPLRYDEDSFYIDYSSCYLECTDRKLKIRFQVATGSEFTSFCPETLKELKISEGEDMSIHIDSNTFTLPVCPNNLKGNVLGMDIITKCYLTFNKGLKLVTR